MVLRITAALLALATLARAEIDFTPAEQKVTFEGQTLAHTSFRNATGQVLYEPPAGWAPQGEGSRLQMRPANATLATASIEARKLPAGAALDGGALQALHDELAASLPREAEDVKWEDPESNPVLLNRHQTRRLTVSYAAFAQHFKITLIVCNFADQQVRFRLDTRAADFEKLYDLFRRSLYTWQGLP